VVVVAVGVERDAVRWAGCAAHPGVVPFPGWMQTGRAADRPPRSLAPA
jgi:hypothetical protein